MTFLVISRAIGYAVLGLVLNSIALYFLAADRAQPGAAAGDRRLALGGLMLIGMTAVYAWFGKQRGLQRAVQRFLGADKAVAVNYFFNRLADGLEKKVVVAGQTTIDVLIAIADRLEHLPWSLRALFNAVVPKAKLLGDLRAFANGRSGRAMAPQEVVLVLMQSLERIIDERRLSTGFGWFWLLLAVNLGLFALLKYLI
ncbi:MAG: hypothetical protein U1F68_07290 [Gammaproteobacteria bacterium]